MSKRNRAHRAATQRQDQDQGQYAPRPTSNGRAFGIDDSDATRERMFAEAVDAIRQELWGDGKPPVEELVQLIVHEAANAAFDGDDETLVYVINRLCSPGVPDDVVDQQVENMVTGLLTKLHDSGWEPRDLAEIGRRRLDPLERSYLLDRTAAHAQRYSTATIDPRWEQQLEEVGASRWWAADRQHFPQWREALELGRPGALRRLFGALGMLMRLPRIEQLMPPPGQARPTARQAPRDVDAKVLARVRGLLAKAESTEFAEEAESLSAKAQELMTRFSLDRALVEADASGSQVTAEASAQRIWLDAPYVRAKGSLVSAVARANNCRTVLTAKLGFLTVLGESVDIQLVEILATSLLVQAGRAMLAAGRQPGSDGQSRTRSYRQSFLVSYARRIGERLTEASEASAAAVDFPDSDRLLPVLASREQRTEELFSMLFPSVSAYQISVSNGAGWAAGRAAADLATLDARSALSG